MPRIDQLLRDTTTRIRSDTPRLDAEILLAHLLGKPRSFLFTWPEFEPDEATVAAFEALVARRIAGEPVAYLTGEQPFWSLTLTVTPDVLIPRPETELLVELALELIADDEAEVLDLGTGSGAIAIALASERPGWRLLACDRSDAALDVAQSNARRHGLDNIGFIASDWYAALPTRRFDLIVSNPPYVRAGDPHLLRDGLPFEPASALVAGDDGLDDIRRIAAGAVERLHDGGWLLLEHGYDQAAAVGDILEQVGLVEVQSRSDLAGHLRATLGRKNPNDRTP